MTESTDHPLRQRLSDVLHERSLPVTRSPVALRSWLYLVSDEDRAAEAQWIANLDSDGEAALHGRLALTGPDGGRIWESHGEFSTYLTFSHILARKSRRPGAPPDNLGFGQFSEDWLSGAAGQRFRSVEIVVLAHKPDERQLSSLMDMAQAVCCDVFGGAARIWSDFRLHEGGAGRIYVQDKGLKNDEVSRLIQSLLEIGHYRKLALLGFPVARDLFGWLKTAETRLEGITAEMTQAEVSQDHVLDQLLGLSAEVEAQVNAVRFRQGATDAYYRLTLDRLASLREERVEGFSTMAEFIQRRLQPAMRTSEAAAGRLNDLSARIGRVSDLLRAKISISLDRQNQDLLKSMNLRSKMQLRMQALVEGLSVFALSYYIFSLLKYPLDPLIKGHGHLTSPIYAALIALIMALVWVFIHHRKRALHVED